MSCTPSATPYHFRPGSGKAVDWLLELPGGAVLLYFGEQALPFGSKFNAIPISELWAK